MRFTASSEAELQAFLDSGVMAEGHHLEAKRMLRPGQGGNAELACDLASLAVDGGVLLLGVGEDKSTGTFSRWPQPLKGLAERVEQVAQDRVTPRLTIRFREIRSDTDAEVGFLIVEVPPSPEAPHMAGNRYYGRGDKTKHALADSEVRRLMDLREDRRVRFRDRLAAEARRDPTPPEARSEAHLFVVAAPTTGRPDMLHDALTRSGQTLRKWAQSDIVRGQPGAGLAWPPGGGLHPDVNDQLLPATRANGIGLHTLTFGQNRIPRPSREGIPIGEHSLLDLEIDDDGTIHLFCGAGTDTRAVARGAEPVRLFFPSLVAGLMVRVIRAAVEVSNAVRYSGSWDIGLQLTNLRGATSSRGVNELMANPVDYTEDGYHASERFLVDDLSRDERSAVVRLCGRLYRGMGEDLATWDE